MFNPYDENSSTGEPPTEESSSLQTVGSSGNYQETSNLSLSSNRSLSVQEPDSGYEASPSSIAENQRFFGEQSNASRQSNIRQSSNVDSDDEYDIINCHSQILFSDSESEDLDDYDTCLDCSSSPVSCSCFRTDSSTTNVTAMTNCDNSRCNSDLSYHRPSSNPIQIPNLPSCRINISSRVMIGSPIDCHLTRSQPTNFSPRLRLGFLQHRLPMSWPNASPVRNSRALSRSNPSNRDSHNLNISVSNRLVRRQLIDSDASSCGSSEDEGPEDVFNIPSGEASSYPTMMMSSVPLPDVVLQSTDTIRRTRSMSINLPPDREQVINDIGQRLRRMSDLFERRQVRMAVMRARSRTASECDDHLHRNGLS